MAEWITPIYNRKQSDVDYAKTRIKYFKENGGSTDGKDLKGCFNYSDMNRIENNNQYLQDRLNKLYYFSSIKNVLNWDSTKYPRMDDISRIINNIVELQSAYHESMLASILPKTLTRFIHVNTVEYNQLLIKEMIDDMVNSFEECGNIYCGEV